jgi:hypothetical protein
VWSVESEVWSFFPQNTPFRTQETFLQTCHLFLCEWQVLLFPIKTPHSTLHTPHFYRFFQKFIVLFVQNALTLEEFAL